MKPHATPHLHTGPDTLPPGGSARRHPAGPAVPEGGTTGGFTSRTAARLAEVTGLAESRDRLMGRLVRLLIDIKGADDLAEVTGGMSLHVWLQHQGRATHAEARDLLAAADVLVHMPATVAGLCDRWLSWPQTIAIARAAKRIPVRLRADLDQLVADAMTTHADWEPDALVHDVWQWIDARQPTRLARQQQAADRGEFVTLTPRLFGGGTLFGELGTVSFATVAEALDAPLGPPVTPPDDLDDTDAVDEALDELEARRETLTRHHGRRLARQLVSLCEHALAGHRPTDGAGEPGSSADGGTGTNAGPASRPRPMLLATIGLDALLDQDATPGWLLHTLIGGRMKIATHTLQQLINQRGADLRSIVLDDTGQIVGVGRRTHIPPDWLREAIWARDTAVRDPDGTTPVRRADLDHIDPWPTGPTDVANLQPVSRRWHNHKTSRHWTVTRTRDGTTVWTHRRHGWTIRLAPPQRDLQQPPHTGPPRLPLDQAGPDPP
jgi:hypothetical protein